MDTNPYAPPLAAVQDPEVAIAATPPFFAVSVLKLAIMSVCTLGLYELYWFYKNWRLIQARERSSIVPAARAFFAVLFCYACFARIKEHGIKLGVTPPVSATANAIGWVLATIMWRLPDPYWWIAMAAFVFVLPMQAYANQVNEVAVPSHERNGKFSAMNWVGIVLGSMLLFLAILGSLVPEQ